MENTVLVFLVVSPNIQNTYLIYTELQSFLPQFSEKKKKKMPSTL